MKVKVANIISAVKKYEKRIVPAITPPKSPIFIINIYQYNVKKINIRPSTIHRILPVLAIYFFVFDFILVF